MSLLTDTDLTNLFCTTENWGDKNKIYLYPFDEKSLTPVGYDIRVGEKYSSALKTDHFTLREGELIEIKPKDTILITSLEKIGMPKNRKISALILSQVSKVSKGLSHISTTIDPDWEGKLLIAIHNHSRDKVELRFGEPFCTVVFFENKSPSTKDCCKIPDRLDIYEQKWIEQTKKAKKKELIKSMIPALIIIISIPIGYLWFGNNPGFVATVASGVAVSQLIRDYIKTK